MAKLVFVNGMAEKIKARLANMGRAYKQDFSLAQNNYSRFDSATMVSIFKPPPVATTVSNIF